MFEGNNSAENMVRGMYLPDGSYIKTFIFNAVDELTSKKTKICIKFHFINVVGYEGLRVSVLSGYTHGVVDELDFKSGTSKSCLFNFNSGVLYEELIDNITSSDMLHAFDNIAYDLGVEGHTPIYYTLGEYDLHLFQKENIYKHVEYHLYDLIESLASTCEDSFSSENGEVLKQIKMYLTEYSDVVKKYRELIVLNPQNQMNLTRIGDVLQRVDLHGEDGKALNARFMPVLHMMAGMLVGAIPAEILQYTVGGVGSPKQLQSVIEAPQVGLGVLPFISQENGSMAFVGLINEAAPGAVQFPQWHIALPGAKAVMVYSSSNLQVRVVRVFYSQAGVQQELKRLRTYDAPGVLFDTEQLVIMERVLSKI